ncbi:MAG: hypothetical protein QXW96_03050, partial [Candidatus Nitrosocaldus sp.]
MNRNIAIAAVIAAVAVGVVVGVIGTVRIGTNTGTAPTIPAGTSSPALQVPTQTPVTRLSGSIVIDGSSTVYPITEVIAEEFSKKNPDV